MLINLEKAYQLLTSGEIIAIPTDTVYGLAASLDHPEAIENLYTIKGREKEKPFVVQVDSYEKVLPYLKTEEIPASFQQLAEKFWPGALTIVLPIKEETIPKLVRAGKATTAFRIPQQKETLELLKRTGPLAVPSANPSGLQPAETAEQVESYFGERFPIYKGSKGEKGQPSTIIAFEKGGWKLLRKGALKENSLGIEFS